MMKPVLMRPTVGLIALLCAGLAYAQASSGLESGDPIRRAPSQGAGQRDLPASQAPGGAASDPDASTPAMQKRHHSRSRMHKPGLHRQGAGAQQGMGMDHDAGASAPSGGGGGTMP